MNAYISISVPFVFSMILGHYHSQVVPKDMGQLLQINLQPSLFFHFLFSHISSHFPPIISISFIIWSIHLVLNHPLGHLDHYAPIYLNFPIIYFR